MISADEIKERLKAKFGAKSIKRVLLIVPPDGDSTMLNFWTAKAGRYYNAPPYGPGLLARALIDDGVEVSILNLNDVVLNACREKSVPDDFSYENVVEAALRAEIRDDRPDLIGVTCMFSMTHKSTVDVCQWIRDICDIPIALGGVHITNLSVVKETRETALRDFADADFLFLYESEIAFKNFVATVNEREDAGPLGQFMILKPSFVHVEHRLPLPTANDLDKIPAYNLMSMDRLSLNGRVGGFHCFKEHTAKFATVLSNRGCRGQCTFCSVRNFNGIGVRGRSIQSVIDEMLILRNEFKIDHFMWLDDDLFYNEKRALELFTQMIKQNVGLTWDCSNGVIAASCTPEILAAAEESGCLGLNIGMESGNPTILKQIRKPGTVKNFLQAAVNLRAVPKIHSRILLMIGFPGETFGMIQDTINVAREMDLDWSYISPLQVLPNTTIFNTVSESNAVDPKTFGKVNYHSGAYGTQKTGAQSMGRDTKNVRMMGRDFKNVFADNSRDAIPTTEDLGLIWAYMNYHINFERLLREDRPIKLKIDHIFMKYLGEHVAPDEAFVHYFAGVLEKKLHGAITRDTWNRLCHVMKEAPYWETRLRDFRLFPSDLLAVSPT